MDIQKLVSEVFVRTPLWNQAHPDHHNRHILNGLWNEVANELGSTRDAVQKKWKYLRDYFRTECAKKTKPKSGDPGSIEFTSSWPHYESLKFLLDQMTNRKSTGNLSTSTQCTSNTPVIVESPSLLRDLEESIDDDLTEIVGQSNDSFASTNATNLSDETSIQEPRCVLANRKRKSQSEVIGNALISLEKQKLQYLKSKISRTSESTLFDEDRHFFDSLMPHVQRIKPENKLLFRNEIQQLVQRYAYHDFINPGTPIESDSSRNTETPDLYTFTHL